MNLTSKELRNSEEVQRTLMGKNFGGESIFH